MRRVRAILLGATCLVTTFGYPSSFLDVAGADTVISLQQKSSFTVNAEVGRYNSITGEVSFTNTATLRIEDINGTPVVVAIGSRQVKLPIKTLNIGGYKFMCFEGSIVYCFNSDRLV